MRGRRLLESKDIANKTLFFMKNIVIPLFLAIHLLKEARLHELNN